MANKKEVQKKSILSKLFNPLLSSLKKEKWQSRKLDVRKKAVQNLPVSDQKTLNQVAMNDTDESIRAIAANKLSDLDLLQTIIMKGTNGTVKEAAQNRLFQLISGLKHPIPDYDERVKMIRGSRNSALLEFVAANAIEAPLREMTIKKISRDPLLGDIALTDESPQIRQLAAQQIAKRSTLERVTKNSRRKDKRVYKIVKTKLDHIIEDEERPALLAIEVVEICNKLEKLEKRNRLLQEKTTFENFVTRWSEIQNFSTPEIKERYHTICSNIINKIDALELDLKNEKNAAEKLEDLLNNLTTAVDDLLNAQDNNSSDTDANTNIVKKSETSILNIASEWDEIIKQITQDDLVDSYNTKFQSILDLADANIGHKYGSQTDDTHQPTHNILDKLQSLAEQAEKMLEKSGFILEKTIAVLQDKFSQQLNSSENLSDEIQLCHKKFSSAIQTLHDRLSVQQKNAKTLKSHIETQSDEIKQLINNGHVSKAEKLLKEQLNEINKSDLISNIEKQNHQNELHQIHSELDDLSSWRNWAHDNERENLTLKAESLADHVSQSPDIENEYSDITSQIKEFRKEWKTMRSHTQEDIWARFNNACNLAYEQCKPFIDKQNEIRANNLKAKQSLCEQLENYINSMNWPSSETSELDHSIDWIQVDKITKQARKEWSAVGFIERKHYKSVSQRFDKDIEIIRAELKKIWEVNQVQFQDLIEKVESLHEILQEDLNNAIHQCKNYQKDWKKIGPVSPYQRNKLWKRFRKACDTIFNKRQENIEQQGMVNSEHLREKEAICENLEALNKQPLKLNDLENAYKDIKNLWTELKPQAKSLSKEVNIRYEQAKENYNNKIKTLIVEQKKLQIECLKEQADLCTKIESLSDDSESTINDYHKQWQSLVQKANNHTELNNRYSSAIESINFDKEALISQELQSKHQFCLKYEVLLGKDTPDEDQQSRMEMQVELLNSNIGNTRVDESESDAITTFTLQQEWYQISNFSQDEKLEERFVNLIKE